MLVGKILSALVPEETEYLQYEVKIILMALGAWFQLFEIKEEINITLWLQGFYPLKSVFSYLVTSRQKATT